MYIGYNVSKINSLMDDIAIKYNTVCADIRTQWAVLKNVLRKEWIGPDEIDFEKRLIERLNKLIESTEILARNSVDVMYELGVAWADFQDKNTISGDSTGVGANIKAGLDKPSNFNKVVIELGNVPSFESTENLGLANAASSLNIQEALTTFVSTVKSKANELFSSIDASSAFMGATQTNKLSQLMTGVGDAVGVVATSIKDFETAMFKLTHTSYTTSDSNVGDELSTARSSVNESLNDLGETRWS